MSKTATAAAPVAEADPLGFQLLPLAKLVESPSNHRKKSWGDLDELAASIKSKGVIVPICVRPAPAVLVEGAYEIVYGHRRYRAATTAGLSEIPARVVDLSDVEVIEWQLVENKDRVDVHPLEEAEGMEQLLQPKGPYTVDDLAAKLGKSRGTVYARLKLLDLTAESRTAFYEGKLSPSTALYLARVRPELQPQALEALIPKWRRIEEEGPIPAREASEILQRSFMCELKGAPFQIGDASLVPAAGACSSCPKRTGAQPQLFADVGSADVCTDPTCFESKRDADWSKRAAAAEAAGKKVLSAKESKEILGDHGVGGGYVALDQTCHEDPKYRTYAKLLGKRAAEAIVLARDPRGATRELVPKKEIGRLLKAAGHDFKAARAGTSAINKADHAKLKAERELEQEVSQRRRAKVLAAIGAREPGDDFWRLAAVAMEDTAHEVLLDEGGEEAADVDIAEHVAKLKGVELRSFVLGLVIDPLLGAFVYGDQVKAQKALYAWAKVDEKAIRAEATKALAAKEAEATCPIKWKVQKNGDWSGEGLKGRRYVVSKDPRGWDESRPGSATGCGGSGPHKTVEEAKKRAEARELEARSEPVKAPPAKGKKGAPPELKWVSADDEHTAEPIDGLVYHVAPTPGGKTWVAKVSTTHGDSWKTLGTFTTLLSDAKKLCQADLLERGADAILANAGDGKLNAKGLKGAAVASKKGGRR